MTTKKGARKPGTFLRIALDGSFGYARVLDFANIAFYLYQTTAPQADLKAIAARPVAFTVGVNASAQSGLGCDRMAQARAHARRAGLVLSPGDRQ
jgi:hypothetical protein